MLEILIEIIKGIVSIFLYSWWLFVIILLYFAWQNRRKASWVSRQESVVLEIKIPKTNDKNPTAAEMMFATLHGILKPRKQLVKEGTIQEHISFEFVADQSSIRFYVWAPKHLKDFVEGQVYAQYPSAEISICEDYAKKVKKEGVFDNQHISAAELKLTKSDYLPIKTFNNFQVDPLAGITGVLSKLEEEDEEIWIQILSRPVTDEWKRKGLNWVAKKKGQPTVGFSEDFGKWILRAPAEFFIDLIQALISGPAEAGIKSGKQLSSEDEGRVSAVELKSEKLGFETKIRIIYLAKTNGKASQKIQAVFGAFKQFNTTNLNGFKGVVIRNENSFLKDYQNRLFLGKGYHLNIEELASIYHLPHTSVETPNINWTTSKTAEAPTDLPTIINTPAEELTVFAQTNFRGSKTEFGIKRDDRRRHVYIIGKSGMGKTKLQELLVTHDIKKGEGVAVMDPHGDFIVDILKKIPEERVDDVILFDPADTNFPIAFNPMEVFDENLKNQIASGVVGTFKKIFGDSWGPRLEYILNYTVLALLDTPGSTLLGIVNMLTDKNYRRKIIANAKDPVVKKFWTTEFASYNEKFATEAIAPILNKVGQFVANSLIRNVIGQPKSSFSIREAMDDKKILLINLSTGRVGETNASLMGSLMITAIQLAAMSRADVPEDERTDFYLYVDEFQNFATESFKNILSEARKYHLNLTIAHQYIAQMEDSGVREAIFGNVGTMITFRVGAEDANVLAKEFNPPFEVEDLVNLERQNIYIKMTVGGKAESAFSARTLTVNNEETGCMDEIIRKSREKYTRPKEIVEREVVDWSDSGIGEQDISLNKDTGSDNSNEAFEAPVVKPVGNKYVDRKTIDLAKVISDNTSHLRKGEQGPTEKVSAVKEPEKPKEPEVKIKDRIDKEILSEILRNVVRPSESKSDNKENSKINKTNSNEINNQDRGESKEKHGSKEVIKDNNTTPGFPSSNREKIITPQNFKAIKQIHPGESVKVVTDTKTHDLGEGQEIKF